MKMSQLLFKKKGITLIELLITLVICGIIVGGIYRIFIAQSKAYTVQDQVVAVQQNIRSGMEILLRDLRMTGFDYDNINSTVAFPYTEGASNGPGIVALGDHDTTIAYEYFDSATAQYQRHTIRYWRDALTSILHRRRIIEVYNVVLQTYIVVDDTTGTPDEDLLQNVNEFNFFYGVDVNPKDGAMDDRNGDGMINDNDWVSAINVGMMKVIAIRVRLSARPEQEQVNPDLQVVSPRTLESIVTLRNLINK